MDEFTDIYRLFAQNFRTTPAKEEKWPKEDVEFLKEKLDKVGALIENGDIVIRALKKDIDNNGGSVLDISLERAMDVVFEIEERVKENGEREFNKINEDITETKPHENMRVIKDKKRLYNRLGAPFGKVLHRYSNAPIYKEIYDHLLEKLPNKFDFSDVSNLIDSIYKELPKRELTHKTLESYTSRYIDYLKEHNQIKIDQKSGMFIRITSEKTSETTKKEKTYIGVAPFSKDQILAKYNMVTIYKPVVEKIMSSDDIPNEFTSYELSDFLFEHYTNVLKRAVTKVSVDVYRRGYVKYLLENNLIELAGKITRRNQRYIKKKVAIPEPSHETPKDEVQIPTPEPDHYETWIGMFPRHQTLGKDGDVYIYKPIVDEILKPSNLPEGFTGKDLSQFIFDYFKGFGRPISSGTADVYRSKYIKYLLGEKLIKKEKIDNIIKFTKITDEKPSEEKGEKSESKTGRPALSEDIINDIKRADEADDNVSTETILQDIKQKHGVALHRNTVLKYRTKNIPVQPIEEPSKVEKPETPEPIEDKQQTDTGTDEKPLHEKIYDSAVEQNWSASKSIQAIANRFPAFTLKEIKKALGKLIREDKAKQRAGEIKFIVP